MCGDVRVQGGDVLVALARQGSDEVGVFDVDEVVGGLGCVEFRLGAGTPAVGLGSKVGDFVDGFGGPHEGGHVGGEILRGEAVDEDVAFAAPGVGGGDGDEREQQD